MSCRAGQFFADSIPTHFPHIWVNMSQTEHFSAQKNKKNPAGPRGVLITGPTPFHSIKPEIKTPLGPAGFFSPINLKITGMIDYNQI